MLKDTNTCYDGIVTYGEERLRNLKIQLQDYLFDKGHTITKPMIDDLAVFVYDLNESHYAQGKIAMQTQKEQS
jgi:hypothetical protein